MSTMSLSSEECSLASMEWKFSQFFGDKLPGEDVEDDDIVSAVEFNKNGDCLAVGDRGGRVMIFERVDVTTPSNYASRTELEHLDFSFKGRPVFKFKTEFQSHEPEFDYLKSLEIEEKINKVRWCATLNGSSFLLSANDKTIKFWKIKENKLKKANRIEALSVVCSENALLAEGFMTQQDNGSVANGYHLESTEKISKNMSSQDSHRKIASLEEATRASCRKVYSHAHDFNINSISNNSDGETFLSADDLRINLWNLERSDQCFNIIDMKPSNMEDLTEVITSAEFHPIHCNLFAYSSSRGFIRLVDMRQSALCDHNARILQDVGYRGPKSFFTEIITCISDLKFTNDGKHILSRDYMNLKVWDLRKESQPISTFKIHEQLHPKLSDLYTNDSIFDKFGCCISGDGLHFATGSYSNRLTIFSNGGNDERIMIEASKNPNRRPLLHSASRARRSPLSNLARGLSRQGHENASLVGNDSPSNFSSKLLQVAWHPMENLIACASGNSLFMYYA